MDEKLRQLLDQMPERPPRSKLEPHREVIRELRKKRRTYQEIAVFFREHLQLSVAPSTIHDFVKTRARQARQKPDPIPAELPVLSPSFSTPAPEEKSVIPRSSSPLPGEGRDRMRALREQPVAPKVEPPRFQFDVTEPLTLKPPSKEK